MHLKGLIIAFTMLFGAPSTFAGSSTITIKKKYVPIVIQDEDSDLMSEQKSFSHRNWSDYSNANRRLRKRVRQLERAMIEMQDEMHYLRDYLGRYQNQSNRQYSCFIQTKFDGTFLGSGSSIAEAKGKTLRACEKKAGRFDCKLSKVSCSN